MKNLVCICFLLSFSIVQANTYYVSSISGDDKRSSQEAQSPLTPWRSLNKINNSFDIIKPGDSILFKRGETFKGYLTVTASGTLNAPIVFSAYGSGARPVISGFTTLKSWTLAKDGIYTCYSPSLQSLTNMVLVNNKVKPKGRYPNYGYMKIESTNGTSQISGSQLSGLPNFSGGEVVIRKNRWIIDRNKISKQSSNTVSYTSDESSYPATAGYGFFIQNHISTLDRTGEWYFDDNKKQFGIFFGEQSPDLFSVQAATVNTLISITNQAFVVFDNLSAKGSATSAFDIKSSNYVTVSNSEVFYSGTNAINAANADNLTIINSNIRYANNIALNISSCSHTAIKGNKIKLTGIFAGMGEGGDGNYEALTINGDNNQIELNIIDSTGYIPINFRGNSVTVKNNYITNFSFVKDDGGGIYSWNNNDNAIDNYDREITGNIILNGKGAGTGTDNPSNLPANGIYMDDNVSGVHITNNTVAKCAQYGILIHNAHEIKIEGNTLYNNGRQSGMVHDNNAAGIPVRNITSSNNIFFSKDAASPVADFKTIGSDIGNFGVFNNNYYCRPADNSLLVNTSFVKSGNWYNNQLSLDGWKNAYKQDKYSKGANTKIPSYKVEDILGSNKFFNGSFNTDIGGLYVYSPASNCLVSWKNGVLDQGALQVSFTKLTGSTDRASVIIGVGAVSAGKRYVLKFSMKGTNEYKAVETFLRKSLSGYNDLSERKFTLINSSRSENEIVFTAAVTEANASIVFNVEEQEKPLYLDNIQLFEATASVTNPDDYIRFEYNATSSVKSISLDGRYIDVSNKVYSNSVKLDPFTSLILLKPTSAIEDTADNSTACSATGTIKFEQWKNSTGNDVSDIPLDITPDTASLLNTLEYRDTATTYGSRFSGYLCAPQSGAYTFFLSGDDAGELWLSTSDDPANKIKIANFLSWTGFREWNKFSSQQSAPITLSKGHKYYIEVLHKQGNGGGHISVAYTLPDGTMEAPMSGAYLSPSDTSLKSKISQTISFDTLIEKTYGDAPFNLSAAASSGLPVTFSIVSGPATLSGNKVILSGTGTVSIKATQIGNGTYKPVYAIRSFNVLPPVSASSCSATGTILLEQWRPVTGNDVPDIPVNDPSASKSYINKLEIANNGSNYGARIRGYICPPQSGNYTFSIAGDDAAELWLSTSDNPSQKVKIASFLSWTGFRDYSVFPSQKSAPVFLKSGQKYYIEVLLKQGEGQDHVSVAWQMPDGIMESPVPGSRLSPYIASSARKLYVPAGNSVSQIGVTSQKQGLYAYPNPAKNTATIIYNPAESGQINLVVNDVNGKAVQPVFKGNTEKGTAKTFLLHSDLLSNGTYFLSLTTPTAVLTQKIIIAR